MGDRVPVVPIPLLHVGRVDPLIAPQELRAVRLLVMVVLRVATPVRLLVMVVRPVATPGQPVVRVPPVAAPAPPGLALPELATLVPGLQLGGVILAVHAMALMIGPFAAAQGDGILQKPKIALAGKMVLPSKPHAHGVALLAEGPVRPRAVELSARRVLGATQLRLRTHSVRRQLLGVPPRTPTMTVHGPQTPSAARREKPGSRNG